MFDAIGGFLSDVGSGISDTVSSIGSGIGEGLSSAGSAIGSGLDYVFDVDDGLFSSGVGWASDALNSPGTAGMGGFGGFGGLGIGNPGSYGGSNYGLDVAGESAAGMVPDTAGATSAVATATENFNKPSAGLLGDIFSKENIKGGLLAGAKELYRRSEQKDLMDWRRELEMDKIRENKRHHGAYYVQSDVKPAYEKPLEK